MSKLSEDPSPPFSKSPKSFPEGPFMTMPALGRPSLEESYPSLLTSHLPWAKQGKVKGSRAPARKISFFSVAYGPKVSFSALAMGGYSF